MGSYYQNTDYELVTLLEGLHAADAADLLGRGKNCCLPLRRVNEAGDQISLGRAFTVKTAYGDNLAVHLAMHRVRPGDFLIVETAPGDDHAQVGEIMLGYLFEYKKISGYATDGFVRDSSAIKAAGWPVYAAGISPKGPAERKSGELQIPVTLCGVTVKPGDLVIADGDGLTIVPPDQVERLSGEKDGFLAENEQRRINGLHGIV